MTIRMKTKWFSCLRKLTDFDDRMMVFIPNVFIPVFIPNARGVVSYPSLGTLPYYIYIHLYTHIHIQIYIYIYIYMGSRT